MLSEHARAKRGDMVLEIDDRLLEAIDKAQRLRTYDEGQRLESNALPSKRSEANGESGVAARLTPREIQQRLRAGETVTALARSSGTDEAWIRRFAAPVLAEKAIVIDRARTVTFNKRGVGPSAAALGPAVAANVIDKGVPLTLPDLEAGWGAFQHPQGGWHVTFTFPLRGRRQTAEWEVDPVTGDLTARNKLGSELAWRESGKKLPQPKPAKAPVAKKPAATKEAATKEAASTSPPPPDKAPAEEPAAGTQPAAAEPAVAVVDPEAAPPEETVQALPLTQPPDQLEPGEVSEVSLRKPRKPPAAPKAAPKQAARPTPTRARSTGKAPVAKRAAAAVTDSPVVDVVVDLRESDADTSKQPAPVGTPPAPQGGPPAP